MVLKIIIYVISVIVIALPAKASLIAPGTQQQIEFYDVESLHLNSGNAMTIINMGEKKGEIKRQTSRIHLTDNTFKGAPGASFFNRVKSFDLQDSFYTKKIVPTLPDFLQDSPQAGFSRKHLEPETFHMGFTLPLGGINLHTENRVQFDSEDNESISGNIFFSIPLFD